MISEPPMDWTLAGNSPQCGQRWPPRSRGHHPPQPPPTSQRIRPSCPQPRSKVLPMSRRPDQPSRSLWPASHVAPRPTPQLERPGIRPEGEGGAVRLQADAAQAVPQGRGDVDEVVLAV